MVADLRAVTNEAISLVENKYFILTTIEFYTIFAFSHSENSAWLPLILNSPWPLVSNHQLVFSKSFYRVPIVSCESKVRLFRDLCKTKPNVLRTFIETFTMQICLNTLLQWRNLSLATVQKSPFHWTEWFVHFGWKLAKHTKFIQVQRLLIRLTLQYLTIRHSFINLQKYTFPGPLCKNYWN